MHHSYWGAKWTKALLRGTAGTAMAASLAGAPAAGLTATPTATPQRPGDLGIKNVAGRVYDAAQGSQASIVGARIDYTRSTTSPPPPGGSGHVLTDASGGFSFPMFLRDTDSISIRASADGYASAERSFAGALGGYRLWIAPPIEFGLLPLSGTLVIDPAETVLLPCTADVEVLLGNDEPAGGEALTITEILPSNSYSQGDYGTGFTWELDDLELPLTLAPGESVAFPVHYRATGQSFPSRLTLQLRSTGRNGLDFAVPYRGGVADCESPTPTPTVTPGPPPCPGDCDGNGVVSIADLVRVVALALGRPVDCPRADLDGSGGVDIAEVIAAVVAAARGCPLE